MKAFVSGFWIISIALVLSFSISCYAQVKTQRFLTPENTAWKVKDAEVQFEFGLDHLGFFDDYIWACEEDACSNFVDSRYENRLISTYSGSQCYLLQADQFLCFIVSGYVIPSLRFGKMKICSLTNMGQQCWNSTLIKDNNNFTYFP